MLLNSAILFTTDTKLLGPETFLKSIIQIADPMLGKFIVQKKNKKNIAYIPSFTTATTKIISFNKFIHI